MRNIICAFLMRQKCFKKYLKNSVYAIIVFINFLSSFNNNKKMKIKYIQKQGTSLAPNYLLLCLEIGFFFLYTFSHIEILVFDTYTLYSQNHVWMSMSLIVIEWATQISSIMEFFQLFIHITYFVYIW